jgi:long-chain fatty acid transport protein
VGLGTAPRKKNKRGDYAVHVKSMKTQIFCAFAALVCAGVVTTEPALAGGFAVREQSTSGLGSAFAGIAVGDDLSSMYWNPAATANVLGMNSESHATLVLPDSTISATSASPYGLGSESGDLSGLKLVGASYYNYQVNDQLFFGLAVNSPFGFTTKPENINWAGETFARTSEIFSINVNPTMAYKVSSQLTIGAGMQFQYIDVTLTQAAIPTPNSPTARVEGDDFGVGVTAGLIWTPLEGTSIGAGYRSAIGVELDGKAKGDPLPRQLGGLNFATVGATTNFYLPEMVTLSARQRLDRSWTLLGTVEWTNWSRMGQINVLSKGTGGYGGHQFGPNNTIKSLDLNWNDGWFFSGGLEYKANQNWTFRGGVAWEVSPIDSSNRSVFLPDSNRLWLSGGLTHKLTERTTIDLAYAHIFFEDAPINLTGQTVMGQVSLQAVGHTDIDLVSASLKYRWGGPRASLEESFK